jgi:hypothetical protein
MPNFRKADKRCAQLYIMIMNIGVLVILSIILFSCGSENAQPPISKGKMADTTKGSTLYNISNSEHAVIQFQIDDKVCFASINQYFKDYKSKSDFPFSFWVTVETREKNQNGHPRASEALVFNKLEDSLISKFLNRTPFCYIGRTTRDGYREIMFYVSDKAKSEEIITEFAKEDAFKRKIKLEITSDPKWETVSGFYQ